MGTLEQPSFASLEFQNKKRKTRREAFLERMDALIPWERLEERIRPHYPKAGRGRQPYDLSVMLRVHTVQVCYNLSDPGMEDLLYEAESVRRFVGLRLIDPLPDESTILHFRHLLERHNLGQGLVYGSQRVSGGARSVAERGHHSGRHHHRGAVLHQEPVWAAGPGDASGEEGEPIPLRDETAHWDRRGDGPGAQLHNHLSQRP